MCNNKVIDLIESKRATIIIGMLLLFFITDATNAVVRYFEGAEAFLFFSSYLKMSGYSRGLAWISIAALLLYKEGIKRELLWIGGLIVVMLIVGVDCDDRIYFFTWVIRFVKLTFPFLLWWFIKQSEIRHPQYIQYIKNTFFIIIGLQLAAVFIPFLFNLNIFLSYTPNRFGYSGFIISRNEATFFYLLSGIFLLNLWEETKSKYFLAGLVAVLLGTLLLGTKAGFLVVSGFMVFLLLKYPWNKNKLVILIIGGVGISAVLIMFFSGMLDFYLSFMYEKGLWTMLTSFRSDLFLERVPDVLNDWNFFNYMFGGVNPVRSFVEMDILDLFLFAGFIGSALYYWGLYKTLFAFKKGNNIGWFLVGMYFLVGGMAGHFFASGVNALYLVLVCIFLQRGDKVESESLIFPDRSDL